jgi:hypothetical protein
MMAVVKVRWPFGGYGSGRVERRLRGPYGGDQSRRRGARAGRRAALNRDAFLYDERFNETENLAAWRASFVGN